MATLTISISDELYQRMERWRDRLNISHVCEKALEKEVHHLDRKLPRDRSPEQPTNFPGPPAPF